MHVRHIVICGLRGSTVFFPHYLTNGTIFGGGLLNIKSVFEFSLQLLSETFLILKRNERDIIRKFIDLHVNYPLLLSDFNEA